MGLWAGDLGRGTIVAEALAGGADIQVLPAPDGRSVYVYGAKLPNAMSGQAGREPPCLAQRMDAATLAVRAEREFAGSCSLLLLRIDHRMGATPGARAAP